MEVVKLNNSTWRDEAALITRARQNTVLCILGLIFNLTLLLVVCLASRLRRSAKYQLVASLSLADLLIGMIYLPFDTSVAFHRGQWIYGCSLMFFTYGLQEFVMPTIASLTLSALCIEYAVTMLHDVTPAIKRRVVLVGVLLPWFLGSLALVPVFLKRSLVTSDSFTEPCVHKEWSFPTIVVLIGLFGFVPLLFLAGSLLFMFLSRCCRPADERMAVRAIRARSHGIVLTHEYTDTTFACLISIVFNLPFLLQFSLHVQCGDTSCHTSEHVLHVLDVLRAAESVFFPVVWMLGLEFRHGMLTSCKCCYRNCGCRF
ncbi:uncharacterized protein LOC143297208 [Babylonia areolata]|uniref:uncharacterized protein LOC143297208 n=1 Tax=Babylonia areolata TaxID=304850 RepID=UPI003FD4E60A